MSAKFKVMIVDDSTTIRVEATRALSPKYECLPCEDGLDAIARVAAFVPDIILLDITMPKINGYETLSIIRLNPTFEKTPIIMMSSTTGVFDVAQGRVLGFSGYLFKPFKSEELHELIDGLAAKLTAPVLQTA